MVTHINGHLVPPTLLGFMGELFHCGPSRWGGGLFPIHSQPPHHPTLSCSPWRIVDDCGGAFTMGILGGGVFQAIKGFRNAPMVSGLASPTLLLSPQALPTAWSCSAPFTLESSSLFLPHLHTDSERWGTVFWGVGAEGKAGITADPNVSCALHNPLFSSTPPHSNAGCSAPASGQCQCCTGPSPPDWR